MAVREGFEPSVRVSTDSRLAGGPVRPLQHLTEWDRYCTYSPVTCKVLPNLGSDPGLVRHGGMAEWSKALVLKTSEVQVSKGSNPFPSASNSSNELHDLLLRAIITTKTSDWCTFWQVWRVSGLLWWIPFQGTVRAGRGVTAGLHVGSKR